MLQQIKDQTINLLDKYKGKISKVDYERLIAYINLLYHFALPRYELDKNYKGSIND